ncbi:hypothetical protein Q8F55_007468 [Vanrija albida]|uniref:1-alkyl-2-acetylglycerophosphocholine esterase n=1 Tax=Vanrija albida TaxID=181172 RepID=A0ABR3PTL7_9TREE
MYIPVLSSLWPANTPGEYKASGYAYVRAPPQEAYTRPTPTLKSDGSPVLELKESAFSLFYPSQPGKPSGVQWVVDPVSGVLGGYEKYLVGGGGPSAWLFGALGLFAGRFKMAVERNAPLVKTDKKLPVVLFSHGLVGTRTTYSQYCTALASEGYIVVSVEHRDHSGPCVIFPADEEHPEGRKVLFTKFAETDFDSSVPEPEMLDLRAVQLEFRVREMYEAYGTFKRLLGGDSSVVVEKLDDASRAAFIASFGASVDWDDVRVAGHSFGGGTAMHLIQTAPPGSYAPLPVTYCVALDPWTEPYGQLVKRNGYEIPAQKYPPTLSINSDEFTNKPMFALLRDASKRMDAALVSMVGIGHQGFSDFPVIGSLPSTAAANYKTMHDLTIALFEDRLNDHPLLAGKADDGDLTTYPGGKAGGKYGDVLVHLKLGEGRAVSGGGKAAV